MTEAAAPDCPECRRPGMLRRTASQGPREGLELWRCTDRTCPGIINIDPDEGTLPAPRPGESAQARFERERAAHTEQFRRAFPIVVSVGVAFAIAVYYGLHIPLGTVPASVAAIVATFAALWFATRLGGDVVSWQLGAEAERRVGVKLDDLKGLGFVTLYDRRFPGRGGNIDAVAIGPTGVFVVETKWRRKGVEIVNGRLEIGGSEQPKLIEQAVDEALRVQVSVAGLMNRHRLTVVPVLCFVNKRVSGGATSRGVLVADERTVASKLAAGPVVLDPDAVQELAREVDRALPRNSR